MTPIDFIIVLDDSGSVEKSGSVEAVKDFAKAIVNGFDLGEDAGRFAVVTFALDATLRAGLSADRSTVSSAIDELRGEGWTSISDGLEMAQREFEQGARPASELKAASW